MDQYSPSQVDEEEPLLSGGGDVKKKSVFVLSVIWILKIIMWIIFLAWVALMFFHPTHFGGDFFAKLATAMSQTLFGPTGGNFMLMSGPILLIAFLSIPYLIMNRDEENWHHEKKSRKKPRMRMWTLPVVVGEPFGVVCAAEFIGILLFYFYVVWALYIVVTQNLSIVSALDLTPRDKCIEMLELVGYGIGEIGLFCIAFLFLPVARGSILLRLIDIPVDEAIRYHIWLGHLIILIFSLHGLCYLIAWSMQGTLYTQILGWDVYGIATFAGVIAIITGFIIWVTSLRFVRKWNFEVFFYTHQLYVVFTVFFSLHVSDFSFSMVTAGIFLFMLDRLLRFCQSRKLVDVVSARCLPCGTVELLISKPKNLRYNALSFIFVQIREISWLQWHPFSISSTPLDGKDHISILIKSSGNWTEKVSKSITQISENEGEGQQYSKLRVCVEGPYGHQVAYYLMYENLILVAGGIGISPFLAILSDILHRMRSSSCLPNNILVIWAIKSSKEIPLLSAINMDSISPHFFDNHNLHIRIYVTRETNPPMEDGVIVDHQTANSYHYATRSSKSKGNGISLLIGSTDNIWSGVYVVLPTMGFIILLALLYVFYINPYQIFDFIVYKGFLFVVCLVATVFIFGGFVIGLWHFWETKISHNENDDQVEVNEEVAAYNNLCKFFTVQYGSRPDFREIFGCVSDKWGHVDIGVIVCGPPSLESSIATHIRSHNLRRESNRPIFHFHSHSFDL